MTETLSIPLNKLVHWDGNVRKTGVPEGIEKLCALRGERHTRRTGMEPDEESRAGGTCCPRGGRDGLVARSSASADYD